MTPVTRTFGCAACLPSGADRAWEAVESLTIESRLVDQSHFTVLLHSRSAVSVLWSACPA